MKNLLFKSIFLIFILGLVSCGDQELTSYDEVQDAVVEVEFQNIDDVIALELDEKFDLPEDVYYDFLEEAIFFDGELAGLKHTGIESVLTDDQSNAFWSNFGFTIRDHESAERKFKLEVKRVYSGYKPITGGCEENSEYTCFGHANDINYQKPINGGCQADSTSVCFNI